MANKEQAKSGEFFWHAAIAILALGSLAVSIDILDD